MVLLNLLLGRDKRVHAFPIDINLTVNTVARLQFELANYGVAVQCVSHCTTRIPLIGIMVRVFTNGLGDWGSIQGRVIPKTKKWYLIPLCLILSTIRYVSRIEWSNPGKGVVPSLHLGEVAIEKGAFGSPLTTVANFTYVYIYVCVCVCVCVCVLINPR